MSPELKAFYQDMQAWIDEDCPHDIRKRKNQGLCDSLILWADTHHPNNIVRLGHEMRLQFKAAGLSTMFPFNNPDLGQPYYIEEENCYANPDRLAWIAKHAATE